MAATVSCTETATVQRPCWQHSNSSCWVRVRMGRLGGTLEARTWGVAVVTG